MDDELYEALRTASVDDPLMVSYRKAIVAERLAQAVAAFLIGRSPDPRAEMERFRGLVESAFNFDWRPADGPPEAGDRMSLALAGDVARALAEIEAGVLGDES